MFFWVSYSLSVLFISYFFSKFINPKIRYYFFGILFIALMTPATIEANSSKLSPAITVFLFDLILEQNVSFRSLRPLLLSVPISIFLLFIFGLIKKRFF